MIARNIENFIRQTAKGYPVIGITGPRQSGKTTLARYIFNDKPYVSLETPSNLEFVVDDPLGFLEKYKEGAIFDEAQRAPQLFSYLQEIVDSSKEYGRFILTGSQQFGLMAGITQSLAGRIALVQLLPFTMDELYPQNPPALDTVLTTGLYPPIHDRNLDPAVWFGNYINTYVERDVRNIIQIKDLASFQRFLRLCAGRAGQLANLSQLAVDAGISHNTAKSWISILEASYITFLLQPFHTNFNKRLIKTPKLYFYDTGLLTYLLSIHEETLMSTHPLRGQIFENFMVSELLKSRFNRGLPSNLYFWRDRSGNEIDVILENGKGVSAIEIKSGQTMNRDFFKGFNFWNRLVSESQNILVYGGADEMIRNDVVIKSWKNVYTIEP